MTVSSLFTTIGVFHYMLGSMSCAMIKDTNGKMIDNGCMPQRACSIVRNRADKDEKYDVTMKDNIKNIVHCSDS